MRSLLSCLIVALATAPVAAELHHRVSLAGGGELSLSPALNGHGFVLARYDLDGLPRAAHFSVELNTDTLRLTVDRLRLGRLELGFQAAGEVLIAGLAGDYFRDGHDDTTRGFYASYGSLSAAAKLDLGPHFIELAATARRWFFARAGGTAPLFTLPPEAYVGELRLRYTLWRLADDVSLWQPQRLFPRLRGVAFGVELGLDERSAARPWGARDPSLAPVDTRNDPAAGIFMVQQWLRAGVVLHRRVRLQIDERATWMWGEDDLVRLRVGGLNPYSVPLVGAPWAGYLAGRVAALQGSLHVRVRGQHEVGLLVDGVVLDDADRTGAINGVAARPGLLAGIGAFADLRAGNWQFDLRGGWSPTLRPGSVGGGVSLFGALGWAWAR
jgi:hypothetical protein